jgi:CubicO group peptidase (beta-lactamase class C family)
MIRKIACFSSILVTFVFHAIAIAGDWEITRAEDVDMSTEKLAMVNKGEYFWGGLATTLFWIDPDDDLVVIMLTQYLPWSEPYYRDLMHRLVYASIVE